MFFLSVWLLNLIQFYYYFHFLIHTKIRKYLFYHLKIDSYIIQQFFFGRFLYLHVPYFIKVKFEIFHAICIFRFFLLSFLLSFPFFSIFSLVLFVPFLANYSIFGLILPPFSTLKITASICFSLFFQYFADHLGGICGYKNIKVKHNYRS